MNARPLAQGDSELMAQHQDLGVLPPRLPPGQIQHRHGPGDDEEDQFQAHKPKIIARPPACKPATSRHARALTLWPPRRICPGSMHFRHPQHLIEEHQADLERAAAPSTFTNSLTLLRQARERLGQGLRAVEAGGIAESDGISLRNP